MEPCLLRCAAGVQPSATQLEISQPLRSPAGTPAHTSPGQGLAADRACGSPVAPPTQARPGDETPGHRRDRRQQLRSPHRPPQEVLSSLAAIELIKAARRTVIQLTFRHPSRAPAISYANGEITRCLQAAPGFLLKVPRRWREIHARGQRLLREGTAAHEVPQRLGITAERWAEICQACAVRVVAMAVSADEESGG